MSDKSKKRLSETKSWLMLSTPPPKPEDFCILPHDLQHLEKNYVPANQNSSFSILEKRYLWAGFLIVCALVHFFIDPGSLFMTPLIAVNIILVFGVIIFLAISFAEPFINWNKPPINYSTLSKEDRYQIYRQKLDAYHRDIHRKAKKIEEDAALMASGEDGTTSKNKIR